MLLRNRLPFFVVQWVMASSLVLLFHCQGLAWDLPDIQQSGVLRHLGIPYANFVTGSGDGLDVELMQRFAQHLGLRYEYIETSWDRALEDLVGKKVRFNKREVEWLQETSVRGDLIASGLTILPYRQQIIHYSVPTFPTGVWLLARADSPLQPIKPSGNIDQDIQAVKGLLAQRTVLVKPNTCLDPILYNLEETGAVIRTLETIRNLNEMVPTLLNGDAETTLLDVPDALIALEKWPGQIKVIGPISPLQEMGVGFPKEALKLQEAFSQFFTTLKRNGTYLHLVKKYYPSIFSYYQGYFAQLSAQ